MRCSAPPTRPRRLRRSLDRTPSSSRWTITESGIATTTCSESSFVRSWVVATQGCFPCTGGGRRVGANCMETPAWRLSMRMRAASSLRRAGLRWRIGTSLRCAGRARPCGCGWTAAPTKRSIQTRGWRSPPLGCSSMVAMGLARGGSSPPPSAGRWSKRRPTGRRRFAHRSRASARSWLPTASAKCCATLSSRTRPRSRREPMAC